VSKHRVQRDVQDLHEKYDYAVGDSPAIRVGQFRANLIREEARETVEAIEANDLVGAIDGMCDVLCVIYGTAVAFGVDLAPFWEEVHRTNMAKAPPSGPESKLVKPPGWRPPDIRGILGRMAPPEDVPAEGDR